MNTQGQILSALARFPSICQAGYGYGYHDENWEIHVEMKGSDDDDSTTRFWDLEHHVLVTQYESEFRRICRYLRDIKKDDEVSQLASSTNLHEGLVQKIGEFPHGLLIAAAVYMGFKFEPIEGSTGVNFNFEYYSYFRGWN